MFALYLVNGIHRFDFSLISERDYPVAKAFIGPLRLTSARQQELCDGERQRLPEGMRTDLGNDGKLRVVFTADDGPHLPGRTCEYFFDGDKIPPDAQISYKYVPINSHL
jgi:hypothetical protein